MKVTSENITNSAVYIFDNIDDILNRRQIATTAEVWVSRADERGVYPDAIAEQHQLWHVVHNQEAAIIDGKAYLVQTGGSSSRLVRIGGEWDCEIKYPYQVFVE